MQENTTTNHGMVFLNQMEANMFVLIVEKCLQYRPAWPII